jgi:hypothetical protein
MRRVVSLPLRIIRGGAADELKTDENHVGVVGGQMPVEHLAEQAARRDANAADLDGVALRQAECDEEPEAFAVAGVAYRLVVKLSDAAREL